MRVQVLSLVVVIFLLSGCETKTGYKFQADVDQSKKKELKIKRYEQALFATDVNDLQNELLKIQEEFPAFLATDLNDTLKLIQMRNYLNDPFLNDLFQESNKLYPDLNQQEEELAEGFLYYNYYYPEEPLPEVYTYISGVDPAGPVIGANNSLIIGIDSYLGGDFEAYKKMGIPNYIRQAFTIEHLPTDVFKEMAYTKVPITKAPTTLLDHMILQGKLIYFSDLMLPKMADSLKIKYTAAKLAWCEANEKNIWALIIENKLLYSTDPNVLRSYIEEGPFTKGLGDQSPGRLGVWMGWNIIKAYMNNHPDQHPDLLFRNENAQDILKKSGYKP